MTNRALAEAAAAAVGQELLEDSLPISIAIIYSCRRQHARKLRLQVESSLARPVRAKPGPVAAVPLTCS